MVLHTNNTRRRPKRMAHEQQLCNNSDNLFDGCFHGEGNNTHERDPPPYPGNFAQFCNPGHRQSYSGSETSTDLSLSSSENLSLSLRQDPQGEENTQFLTNRLDGLDADTNYGLLSGLGRTSNGMEIKSSNPGTFYVTGSPSRSSSTSSPQSDISDISSILQFIASTGAPSYTGVSPAESFNSGTGGGAMYSTAANQHVYQPQPPPSMQYQQQPQQQHALTQQQEQQHVLFQQQLQQGAAPKKLQRPKSANVPLTKDVVRDLQQQASMFLEEQCQQYYQATQDPCLQQHLQRSLQLTQQQHDLERQLQQHQNLFIGSHHQDPFLPHYFSGSLFHQLQPQLVQQQQQQQQHPAHMQGVGAGTMENHVKPTSFQFSSLPQGQSSQAFQDATATPSQQALPPYTQQTQTPVMNSTNPNDTQTMPKTSTGTHSAQSSSGNSSPSYMAMPLPLPMPPQGYTLNPVGNNARPVLQRQSSGSQLVQKLKPSRNVQPPPQLLVKPMTSGNDQTVKQMQLVGDGKSLQQQQEQSSQQSSEQKHLPPPKYPGVVANETSVQAIQSQTQSKESKKPANREQKPTQSCQQQQQQQQQRELRRSFEMLERMQSVTLSQPDLTKLLAANPDDPPKMLLALSGTDLDLSSLRHPPTSGHEQALASQQPPQQETPQLQEATPQIMQQETPQLQEATPQIMQQQQHVITSQQQQQQQPQVNFQQPVQQQMVVQAPPTEHSPQNTRSDLSHAAIANRATEMVERLSQENNSLRKQLQGYCGKLSKLQKFEMEIKKISDAYESLVKHSHKRENLEKLMRMKLDTEMKKFKAVNYELKEQLDRALSRLQHKDVYNQSDTDLRRELSKKDSMISKLLSQNKEMTAAKERLEIETTAQRSTLQEQRTHIEILDKALTNAQTSIIRMEDELRKKAIQDEKIEELQRAVRQLQLAAAKREAVEQRLRGKLEEEIRNLKDQHHIITSKASDTDEGIASDCESTTGPQHQGLMQQLREKDQRILTLESDMLKWEQRYLEETALRHLAVDAVSMPKDMRIAALEQSSAETEKMIADARTDRLKHLEEVYQANRRAAELEAQVKSQAAQLAERDAMIAVLQKHSSLSGSRNSSVSSLLGGAGGSGAGGSPLTSPLPTLSSPLSSLITSTVATLMSQSLPSRAGSSGTNSPSSRQSSTHSTDSNSVFQEAKPANHIKSSSSGSTASGLGPSTAAFRDLQQRIAAQTALLQSMQQNGGDQLSKVLWQV